LRKNVGSGSVKNQSGSTTLIKRNTIGVKMGNGEFGFILKVNN
jgi:hypothetical protein